MRSEDRYDWRRDQEALQQLDTIRDAKIALGVVSREMTARDYRDPELLLTGHSGIHDLLPGDSAVQQFENLRVAFDEYLSRTTAIKGIGSLKDRWPQLDPWAPPDVTTLSDVQSSIDRRTVILDYFLGEDCDRQPMLYVFCITSERVA
jgi:hypothetical protein